MFYPAGFMDVVQIEKTKDLPGEKGRFGRVPSGKLT
jgi:ribosomal protein S4E